MLEKEYKILLDNIVWLRKHYEFSIERMADIMGISIEMLNEVENGKLPDELTVEAISNMQDFFRIEPQILLVKNSHIPRQREPVYATKQNKNALWKNHRAKFIY